MIQHQIQTLTNPGCHPPQPSSGEEVTVVPEKQSPMTAAFPDMFSANESTKEVKQM